MNMYVSTTKRETTGRIFVTGDTHGSQNNDLQKLNSKKFPEGKHLTKNDYVVIVGDFGFLWNNIPDETEKYWLRWFDDRPWTTLFLAGNHENYERLNRLIEVPMFNNFVGQVSDSVFFLQTGCIYTIHNNTFFVFGGARSIDKAYRTPYVSWWSQEEPSYQEMIRGISSLESKNKNVDYILTHEAPAHLWPRIVHQNHDQNGSYQLPEYIQYIEEKATFKKHFFGHHHKDMVIDQKYVLCYNTVHELEV